MFAAWFDYYDTMFRTSLMPLRTLFRWEERSQPVAGRRQGCLGGVRPRAAGDRGRGQRLEVRGFLSEN